MRQCERAHVKRYGNAEGQQSHVVPTPLNGMKLQENGVIFHHSRLHRFIFERDVTKPLERAQHLWSLRSGRNGAPLLTMSSLWRLHKLGDDPLRSRFPALLILILLIFGWLCAPLSRLCRRCCGALSRRSFRCPQSSRFRPRRTFRVFICPFFFLFCCERRLFPGRGGSRFRPKLATTAIFILASA